MPSIISVACKSCGLSFAKTLKQVNQAIKKNGFWRCANCGSAPNKKNLLGFKTKYLTVIDSAGVEFKKTKWLCRCVCGKETFKFASNLKPDSKSSCGCMTSTLKSETSRTHDLSGSKEYKIWRAMKTRCCNKNTASYKNYGARSINVCDRWLNSFENFLEDMGPCPDGFSIDRINNDGIYEPQNCRWADKKTQARNTRRNAIYEHQGEKKCLSAWADDFNMHPSNFRDYVIRLGFSEAHTLLLKRKEK